jgi:hypothetical protein
MQRKLTNEQINEIFFDMLSEKKTFKEIKKRTGIKRIETNDNVITLHYPNGEIISHWV